MQYLNRGAKFEWHENTEMDTAQGVTIIAKRKERTQTIFECLITWQN